MKMIPLWPDGRRGIFDAIKDYGVPISVPIFALKGCNEVFL